MDMGQRLREVRIKRNKTLEDVGLAINTSATTISKYESGRIKTIPKQKLDAMAAYLDVNPLYILGYEEYDVASPTFLSINEQIMIQEYRELDEMDRKTIAILIHRLIQSEEERKTNTGPHYEQLSLL